MKGSRIDPRQFGGTRVKANNQGSFDIYNGEVLVKSGVSGPSILTSGFGQSFSKDQVDRLIEEAFTRADGSVSQRRVDELLAKAFEVIDRTSAGQPEWKLRAEIASVLKEGEYDDPSPGGQPIGSNGARSPEGQALFALLVFMLIGQGMSEADARRTAYEMCGGSMPHADSPSTPLGEADAARPPADGIAPVAPGLTTGQGISINNPLANQSGVGAAGGDREAGKSSNDERRYYR